ncbi:hypothetical protein EMMF5_000310 [Cystobasidiomycetes sp. EMM_F5]
MPMKAELIERIRDYLLVLFGFTTQLIGFGLLIHALIGPTPNWRMGSSFLRLQSLSTEEVPVSNLYLGPMPTGVWCQKPSFTPDITALLDMANIPEELVPHVTSETAWAVGFPLEQPDLPGVLLFTIIATLLSAILVIPTSLSRTLPPYSAVRVRMQQIAYWPTAVGVGWTVLVLVFAITVAACFELEMSYAAQIFDAAAAQGDYPWVASTENGLWYLWGAVGLTTTSLLAQLGLYMTLPDPQYKLNNWGA